MHSGWQSPDLVLQAKRKTFRQLSYIHHSHELSNRRRFPEDQVAMNPSSAIRTWMPIKYQRSSPVLRRLCVKAVVSLSPSPSLSLPLPLSPSLSLSLPLSPPLSPSLSLSLSLSVLSAHLTLFRWRGPPVGVCYRVQWNGRCLRVPRRLNRFMHFSQ